MLACVVHNKRRDETRLKRYLAAWEALAAVKPPVRVVALIGACPSRGLFQHGCGDAGQHRGINGLPEDVPQLIVSPEPQGTTHLGRDDAQLERRLIFPCPDAALVES